MAGKGNKETQFTSKIMKSKCYIGAVQEYNNGGLSVCFTADSAYIFDDADGLYGTVDMVNMMKTADKEGSMSFPHSYEPYTELCNLNTMEISPELTAQYGISEADATDIISRLDELSVYGEEKDFKF